FGALDAGDPGDRQRVALGHLSRPERRDGLRRQQHPPAGAGLPDGHVLAGDVHHPRVPGLVKVRETAGPHGPTRTRGGSRTRRGPGTRRVIGTRRGQRRITGPRGASGIGHGSNITTATSPSFMAVTCSGTMISALARASAPSWWEPWPVSGVTAPESSTPRRNDLLPSGER